MHIQFIVALLIFHGQINAFIISQVPICTTFIPNSILDHKEKYWALPVGDRSRYGTCSGTAWFHENYIAVVNLFGHKIEIYRFNSSENSCTRIQEINNTQDAHLIFPENVACCSRNNLLALCQLKGINVYRINAQTHTINPRPIFLLASDHMIHNVKITPDGRYMATTGWDQNNAICVYKITNSSNNIKFTCVYRQKNPFQNMKPKGIAFTKDSKFAVICYATRVNHEIKTLQNVIVSHSFDAKNGRLGNPICQNGPTQLSTEDICFINNDRAVLVTDQAHDTAVMYPFNRQTGQFSEAYTVLKNPAAALSFPHGLSSSADGNYLAIANYGDDKFTIYKINQEGSV